MQAGRWVGSRLDWADLGWDEPTCGLSLSGLSLAGVVWSLAGIGPCDGPCDLLAAWKIMTAHLHGPCSPLGLFHWPPAFVSLRQGAPGCARVSLRPPRSPRVGAFQRGTICQPHLSSGVFHPASSIFSLLVHGCLRRFPLFGFSSAVPVFCVCFLCLLSLSLSAFSNSPKGERLCVTVSYIRPVPNG